MEELFLKLLNMGLTGAAVILAVCLARLALRRSPKVISYALWAVVFFRLLCPVSLSSGLSALNLVKAPVREVSGAASSVEYLASDDISLSPAPAPAEEEGARVSAPSAAVPARGPDIVLAAAWLWFSGALAMAGWGLVSFLRLRRRLVGSVAAGDGVYVSDYIGSPFVFGLFRPRIYLPSSLPEPERGYIVAHERHHIRRLDPLSRLLGYAALCLHWYNPFVWLAFLLSGRDMEMSCDEAVLCKLGAGVRADYSASLLRLSSDRRPGFCLSLAFGGEDIRGRINNLGRWKKPALWAVLPVAAVCAVAAVCLLTNPSSGHVPELDPVLDSAVREAIAGNELAFARDECIVTTAYEPLLVEELDSGGYTVYAAIAAMGLYCDGNGVCERAPLLATRNVELSFRTDGNGGLRLTGYWQPDYDHYFEQLLERFPEEAAVRAFNRIIAGSNRALGAQCMDMALEETGIDPGPRLDSLFAQLEASSADAGVTAALQADYQLLNELMLYGEHALDYCKAGLKTADGTRAELLELTEELLEELAASEKMRLKDPLDLHTRLRLERIEGGQPVETLELEDPYEVVSFLTHSLRLENSRPAASSGAPEFQEGYVVYESYSGPRRDEAPEISRCFFEFGGGYVHVFESGGETTVGDTDAGTYEYIAGFFA